MAAHDATDLIAYLQKAAQQLPSASVGDRQLAGGTMAWVRIVALLWMAMPLAACMTLPGVGALQAGNYEKAIEEATVAINKGGMLRTNEAGVYSVRAIAYQLSEQYDLALKDFDRSIELYPSFHASMSNKGVVYMYTNRYEQAIEQFNMALEISRSNTGYLVNRGAAYARAGQYGNALADYTEALRLEPRNLDAQLARTVVYLLRGENDRALSDATTAVGLAPDDRRAFENRCEALLRSGMLQEALADCEKVQSLAPDDADVLRSKAYVLLKLQRYGEAASAYDESLRIEPMSAVGLFGRGTARVALGDRSAGSTDVEAATRLNAEIAQEFDELMIRRGRPELRLRGALPLFP